MTKAAPQPKKCRDCVTQGVTALRPTPHPGPRCSTHHRERRRAVSARSHGNRIEKVYGITPEQYWAIYAAQDGRCAICQRGMGKSKRLAVDHDHTRGCGHDPKHACPQCVRGLLDNTCNAIVVGRYDIQALARAIHYLVDPPAQKVLNPHHEEANGTTT